MDQVTRIVVTGSKGLIAAAVVRHLRSVGFAVDALEQGDDLAEAFRSAAAIIVLDATVSEGVDYRHALEAVADAVEGTSVSRVVAVGMPRVGEGGDDFLKRAQVTEAAVTFSGPRFTAIRVGFVLGAPHDPAPVDASLFFPQDSNIPAPRAGEIRLRPLLLSDLGPLVVGALARPDPPAALTIEGPKEMSLRNLLVALNWPRREVKKVALGQALAAASTFFPLFASMAIMLKFLEVDWSAWVWIVAAFVAAVFSIFVAHTTVLFGPLPMRDQRLRGSKRSSALGVSLNRIGDVWTVRARKARSEQAKWRRSALSYSVMAGAPWIACFLGICGVATLGLGLGDLFVTSVGFAGRIAALTLTLVGAVMVFGAVALFKRWPSRYALTFLASVVCALPLLTLWVAAIVNRDPPPLTLLFFYPILGAIWCCTRLWRRGGLVVRDVLATRGERMLGSVILGGTIVTLAQLLYSAAYLPASATPSVSGEASLTADKMPNGILQATVKLRNPTDHPVVVLASPSVVDFHKRRVQAAGTAGAAETSRLRQPAPVVIDTFHPWTSLERGQELTRRFTVPAPTDGHTIAGIRIDVALARSRYRAKVTPPTKRELGGGVTESVVQIDDPSLVHRVTRSPRFIHVVHARGTLPCPHHTSIAAYVDGSHDTARGEWCADRDRIDAYYGLRYEQFSAETPIG